MEQGRAAIVERFRRRYGVSKVLVRDNPSAPKLSQAILDVARPILRVPGGAEAMKRAMVAAVLAWNAALMPPEKREAFLNEFAAFVPAPYRKAFRRGLEALVQRKWELFPHDERLVTDYEIVDLPGHVELVVSHAPAFSRRADALRKDEG
jgi:hypothetical protein